jgi:RNA polymerase sigma-70 factor (ECF subfamily)
MEIKGGPKKMQAHHVRDEEASPVEDTPLDRKRPKSANVEEQEIVERLQAGDTAAFDVLFHRYGARVARQAIHLLGNEAEAEEVVQEVFLTFYEKAHTFRGDAALSTWLYRLTANAALSRLRRHKRRPEVAIDEYLPRFRADGHHLVRPVVDWSADVEQAYAGKELRRLLQQAIDMLTPLDKAVVVLSDIEGLSNRDIGAMLGLSIPAVKARLHRVRLCLRGKLAVVLGHAPGVRGLDA